MKNQEHNAGQFALILAHCNYASLRSQLVERLQAICSVEIRTIILQKSATTLYTIIQEELGDEHVEALVVLGLESVQDLDRVLTSTNQVREEFRRNFQFPLVLWVNDEILRRLARLAPDFTNWATTTKFSFSTDTLIKELRRLADHLFTKVLELDAEPFVSNDVILGTKDRRLNNMQF